MRFGSPSPMLLAFALAGVAAIAGTAAADKPTAAQALATARAWLDGLGDGGKVDGATPHSASSFYAVVRDEGPDDPKCAETTATTAAALAKLLACLAKHDVKASELRPWTKASLKQLAGPLSVGQKKKLAQLESAMTLVTQHEPCAGQGSDVILAVTLEKVKDKQVPRVAAVLAQSYFCGE